MEIKKEHKVFVLFRVLFWSFFLLLGLYTELTCCIASIALMMWLLLYARQDKIQFSITYCFIGMGGIMISYMLSNLWAIDRGIAFGGIIKCLPIVLFGFGLDQMPNEERTVLKEDLSEIGCVMTISSFILGFIPVLKEQLWVNGRLGGWFCYPNTYACFLLVALASLLLKEKISFCIKDMIRGIILILGIGLSGSRVIFVMLVGLLIVILVKKHKKKEIVATFTMITVGIASSMFIDYILKTNGMNHIATLATKHSTLWGRLLYWKDALSIIKNHPLGFGYMGYYFLQGTIQTGSYSVRWVHNGLLQLLLDVGWIPTLLGIGIIAKMFLSKKNSFSERIIILILCLHTFVDFDFQFSSIVMIFFLCTDPESDKIVCLKKIPIWICPLLFLLNIGCLYYGIVSNLLERGQIEITSRIAPWNTFSNMERLVMTDDFEKMNEIAESILEQNQYVSLAWDAKAQVAYAEGDIEKVIEYKKNAIQHNKYQIEEYIDYFEKLQVAVQLYEEMGDLESATICESEIYEINTMLEDVIENTSPWTKNMNDQQELKMPKAYYEYISLKGR